ncbi:SDR family oxidoreductase [Balneolaceae bacterium ANBcel3]|nr:SDR family oxidoreductase [Balneolaceae bacterium ANBcel3]
MDLKLTSQHFLVTGCSSGFGKAITTSLCREGALVTGVARQQDPLSRLHQLFPEQFTPVQGDLLKEETLDRVVQVIAGKKLHGLVLNAGGPPAKLASDTTPKDWDDAYKQVFRWKVDLVLRLIPRFAEAGYGRILFIESQSVKQPIPSLALSTAMRAAVTGFAKSLSRDLAPAGVTVNVIAPGPHNTPAIERVIQFRSQHTGENYEEAKRSIESAIPVGRFGTADELAGLATCLLSRHSGYITGQSISHDGGNVSGLFG